MMIVDRSRSNLTLVWPFQPPVIELKSWPWIGTVGLLELHRERDMERMFDYAARLFLSIPLIVAPDRDIWQEAEAFVAKLEHAQPRQVTLVPMRPSLRTPHGILEVVNNRPLPSQNLVARWLALRLTRSGAVSEEERQHRQVLQDTLIEQITDALRVPDIARSPRTVRWRVHQILHCRPSDLRRLRDLALLPRLEGSVERLAANAGTTATRLRARVTSGLDLDLRHYNRMPGWEPVLEAAVRAGLGAPGTGWGVRAQGLECKRTTTDDKDGVYPAN